MDWLTDSASVLIRVFPDFGRLAFWMYGVIGAIFLWVAGKYLEDEL